jgi:hypothetical protein
VFDRSRLSVVDADGTGLKALRRIVLDHDEGGLPRWSPDGPGHGTATG